MRFVRIACFALTLTSTLLVAPNLSAQTSSETAAAPAVAVGAVETSILRDGSIGPGRDVQPESILGGDAGTTILLDESLGERPGGGSNLFHSFERFDLAPGDRALFRADPARVTANVIARVTGGLPSQIQGALASDISGASLFFLNPAGILLGPGARLDVDGSVHLSTASSLHFSDGTQLSVDAASSDPLLSVAPPAAFGFVAAAPRAIEVRESSLNVPVERTLSLVGGDVEVRSTFAQASVGRIALLGVGGPGLVPIDFAFADADSMGFAFARGSVRALDTLLSVSGRSSGALLAVGRSVELTQSALLADSEQLAESAGVTLFGSQEVSIRGGLVSSNGASGPVTIRGGQIRIEDGASFASELVDAGVGSDLRLSGDRITIADSILRRGISGSGRGGHISVEASDAVEIRGSTVFTETSGPSSGLGGSFILSADRVTLQANTLAGTRTTGSGAAGNVFVRGAHVFVDTAGLGSETTLASSGRTGDVRIDAGLLSLSDALAFGVRSAGSGRSGNVELFADTLSVRASQLTNQATSADAGDVRIVADRVDASSFDIGSSAEAGGRSGDIQIRAGTLTYTGVIATQSPAGSAGSVRIEARTARIGPGPAVILSAAATPFANGSIELRVDDLVLSRAFVSAGDRNGLFGGDVRIVARSLLLDESTITARNRVDIDAEQLSARFGSVIGSESGIALRSDAGSSRAATARNDEDIVSAPAGDVRVTADRIELATGSRISSTTFSDGRAGDVNVRARTLELSDVASIDSRSTGRRGDAGTIRVQADRVDLRSGARIATSTNGPGDAGRIELEISERLVLDGRASAPQVGLDLDPSEDLDRFAAGGRRTEISSSALSDASFRALPLSGDAGEISIQAAQVRVSDGAQVTSSNQGTGRAGSIVLASDRLTLNDASISTDAARGPLPGDSADGNIRLSGEMSLVLSDSTVSASVGTGQGGNIDLAAPGVLLLRGESRVLAQTEEGTGGRIRLSSPIVLQDPASRISADAGVGQAGTIELNTPELNLDAELAALEVAYQDPAQRIRPSCELRPDPPGRLILTAREHPSAPGDALDVNVASSRVTSRTAETEQARAPTIVQTRGLSAVGARLDAALPTPASGKRSLHGAIEQTRKRAHAARAALEAGDLERAQRLVHEATQGLSALSLEPARVIVTLHLAKTELRLAEADAALRRSRLRRSHALLLAALRDAQTMRDDRLRASAYGLLGRAYRADRRLEEALYLTRLAAQTSERAGVSELAYRWAWQEAELLRRLDRIEPALAAYRRAVDALDDARVALSQDREGRARTFQREIEPVYLELADLLLQRAEQAQHRGKDPTPYLTEARDTVERLKSAELRNYFHDDCSTQLESRTTQLDQVAGNAAVIYPVVLPDRLELLVRLPSGLMRFRSEVTAAELERISRRFRRDAHDRLSNAYLRSGRTLYDWLIAPYAAELATQKVDTLVFVPDARLRLVPIAALHDGKRFLIERYALAVTPGLSLLDPKPLKQEGARMLLAGVSEPVQSFDSLPSVPLELREIQKLFGGAVLLDHDFSTRSLDAAVAEDRPTLIHVASHVVFTGDPRDSYVLTHDSKLDLDQFARILQRTRYREDPLELLVLSACRTAVDDPEAGLGLAGIAIRSGARSVVGSLWDLSDEASYELVVEFYRQLRASHSRAEALRRAQLTLLDDPELSHPFYWSPFLLVNTWL